MGRGDRKWKPRKSGKREPNGRLSRVAADVADRRDESARRSFEDGPTQTVLRARRRQHKGVQSVGKDKAPVTKAQAHDMRLMDRGSVLGNWLADEKLTGDQVQVGEDYCRRYLAYASLNGLPLPTAKIASYSDSQGGKGTRPERIEAAIAAKAAHMEDQRILRHCSPHNIIWAIGRACVRDEMAPLDLVRIGLTALTNR
jgi:hypothetical protein